MSSSAKNNILNKIKQALKTPVPVPFEHLEQKPLFIGLNAEPDIAFAENFISLQGKFSFCLSFAEITSQLNSLLSSRQWKNVFCNNKELKNQLQQNTLNYTFSDDLANCDVAITECEYLVAATGGIVLSSATPGGRSASVYAPVHVCIATTNQLVNSLDDAITAMKKKYKNNMPSVISFATGPSRTADIEKTLVTGVHGPKEVYCFLLQA